MGVNTFKHPIQKQRQLLEKPNVILFLIKKLYIALIRNLNHFHLLTY